MDDSDKTDNTDKLAGMAAIVKKSPVFRLWKSGNPIALRRLSYRLLFFYVYSPGVTVISRLGPIQCETGESRLVAFVLSFSP